MRIIILKLRTSISHSLKVITAFTQQIFKMQLGYCKSESCAFFCNSSRLSLYFHNSGCGSAIANQKATLSFATALAFHCIFIIQDAARLLQTRKLRFLLQQLSPFTVFPQIFLYVQLSFQSHHDFPRLYSGLLSDSYKLSTRNNAETGQSLHYQ